MSKPLQSDLHPDAESLSALAEHLLPEAERQPILAHLAACPRCRQILFLAQDAAEVEAASSPAAGPVLVLPRQAPKIAIRRWGFAAAALAACAALAAVSIVFSSHHRPTPPQQAKVAPAHEAPSAPAARPAAPAPALRKQLPPQPETIRQPAPPPYSPAAQPPADQARKAEPAGNAAPPAAPVVAQANGPVPISAASPPVLQSTSQTVTVAAESAVELPAAQIPPVTQTMPLQRVEPAKQLPLQGRNAPPIPMQSAGSAGGTSSGYGVGLGGNPGGPAAGSAVAGVSGAPHGAPPNALPNEARGLASAKAPAASFKVATRALGLTPEDSVAAGKALHSILPSGLEAVSTASLKHHLLALDSAGALFLSEDAGSVWEPVPPPWTGRAAKLLLRLEPAPAQAAAQHLAQEQAEAPASTPTDSDKPIEPALFQIVTGDSAIWTSADGRSWRAK